MSQATMPEEFLENPSEIASENQPEDTQGRLPQQPQNQAAVFQHVRRAHQMETTEDYVELIDDLITSSGEARLVDVALRLGVSQPTASKTLGRLQREGFIKTEPYRSIFLTKKGKKLANASRKRHDIVFDFLRALGVSEATAKQDSEGLEHHVSAETLAIFENFINSRSG